MLRRYKVKAEEGFKKLCLSLEQSPEEKQKQIIQAMFLEDPIYTQFLPLNILSFEYILELEPHEIAEIWSICSSPAKTFVYAFAWSEEEQKFLKELLPKEYYHLYNDEKESIKSVETYQKRSARNNLIEFVRKLQDSLSIRYFSWKFPSKLVLKGEHIIIPKEGHFELFYDNDKIAMEGKYEEKQKIETWTHYFSNGKVMATGEYLRDEKVKKWQFFYPDGELQAEGNYVENLRDGEWKLYDRNRNPSLTIYSKGQIASNT